MRANQFSSVQLLGGHTVRDRVSGSAMSPRLMPRVVKQPSLICPVRLREYLLTSPLPNVDKFRSSVQDLVRLRLRPTSPMVELQPNLTQSSTKTRDKKV